jgi:hypothetical protein
MAMTDDAMMRLCDAMREQYGAGVEFELSLGELVGRYRRAFDRRQQDAEAARLLPLGPKVAAVRQRCHRSTIYRRVSRAKKVARLMPSATKDA